MNECVSEEIVSKYPTFIFRGKSWRNGGFTWINAYHKTLDFTFRFCIELECGADPVMYEYICEHGKFA